MKKIILWGGGFLVFLMILGAITSSSDKPETITGPSVEKKQKETKVDIPKEVRDYSIDFSAQYLVGQRAFQISGTTDLPDSSILNITIKDKDYDSYDSRDPNWRYENLTYIVENATVRDGNFSQIITASEFEAPLTSENYLVIVSFNPRYIKQPSQVKKTVGESGEYLGGEFINTDDKELTKLEKSIVINLTSGANSVVWNNPKAKQICLDNPGWTKNECEKLADGKIWIGMSYEMLKYKRGLPDSANPSNYGGGTEWQWCWLDYTPSCFYDTNNDGNIDSYN